MAKILVIDTGNDTRIPFLRGILTRSLNDAGLPFEEAYEVASQVRQELGDIEEISTEELRNKVLDHLSRDYGSEVAQRYETAPGTPTTVMVRSDTKQLTPFSRSQHRRCLESCGLTNEESTGITDRMFEHLMKRGTNEISAERLRGLTYRYLHRDVGPEFAARYLVWTNFLRSGRPLLLLIGGTAGCGKSTLATELAHQLEIVRTQSTDMLREVMRVMVPKRLLPVLHVSSFAAWQELPFHEETDADPEALLADGYLTQAELVSVACEAVVHRALRERVSLIVEGVHIQPGFLERLPQDSDAIVVQIMLGVLKPEQLRQRIRGRSSQAPERRARRYIKDFDSIWRLQSFLLSEADRLQVPIIPNDDKEKTIQRVMGTIINTLASQFSAVANKAQG